MSIQFHPAIRARLPMTRRRAGSVTSLLSKSVAILRERMDGVRDGLWDALEWLAMPVFILYPQLAVLKWYRYGA